MDKEQETDSNGDEDFESASEYSDASSTMSSFSTVDLTRSLSKDWSVLSPSVPTLLSISFNQDSSCFSAGTDRGFRIFNCSPFGEQFRREFGSNGGGIATIEMLFRTNIYALIGGGSNPPYPPNKVMIWDDQKGQCTGELSFRSDVKSVRLRRDRIVVILVQKIFVYNIDNLKLLSRIDTATNPNALCEITHSVGPMVLACPGLQRGQIRVELYGTKVTKFLAAHNSDIACIALTNDGRLLATAGTKGTLVRVFNVLDGSLLKEVRRGADRADINCLAFSLDSQWLAVSSDKGTAHVFCLKVYSKGTRGSSSIFSLSYYIKGMLPSYFSSEWSVSQFRLQEGLRYIVAFGNELDTIVIVGMDGSFYRCQFDPVSGGEMKLLECANFLQPEDAF